MRKYLIAIGAQSNMVPEWRALYVLAFDIGGAHVTAAVCSSNALIPHSRFSIQIDDAAPLGKFLDEFEQLGRGAVAASRIDNRSLAGVAVAVPGPFDEENGISYVTHKLKSLYGVNLRNVLAERFGIEAMKVKFLNDADAFMLGELSQPRSVTPHKAVGITLGTGIGSAFAVDGVVVRTGAGVPEAGGIWNLPWGAGIVEQVVSTDALQTAYEKETGRRISVRDIALRCPGDVAAAKVFKEFGMNLGKVVNGVCAEFAPELLILGGGISQSSSLFLPYMQDEISWPLKIEVSILLDNAALVGAASYWNTSSTC